MHLKSDLALISYWGFVKILTTPLIPSKQSESTLAWQTRWRKLGLNWLLRAQVPPYEGFLLRRVSSVNFPLKGVSFYSRNILIRVFCNLKRNRTLISFLYFKERHSKHFNWKDKKGELEP